MGAQPGCKMTHQLCDLCMRLRFQLQFAKFPDILAMQGNQVGFCTAGSERDVLTC